MTNSFYSAFEAHFRGSREEIKARLMAYAPFWEPFLNLNQPGSVVDLGCGRGEWLELMQGLGFDAFGVDLDEGMLSIAHEHGVNAIAQDAIAALGALPNESQAIVSGFHIAEHLPFEVLQQLVQEAHRVLRPGGLLILETPNPENIAVATNYFYIDPTHIRPLSPDLMAFLPKYYGFDRVKIVRLQEDVTLLKQPTLTIAQIVHGVSPDYAVVAQKGASQELMGAWDGAFERSYGLTLGALSDRFYRIDAAKQAEIELWRSQYMNLVNSSSWRITAPLRTIKKTIADLKKNSKKLISLQGSDILKSVSGAAVIRRNLGRLTRKIPFLHDPMVLFARSMGVLPPASKSSDERPLNELESLSQLTYNERKVFNRFEEILRLKKNQKT